MTSNSCSSSAPFLPRERQTTPERRRCMARAPASKQRHSPRPNASTRFQLSESVANADIFSSFLNRGGEPSVFFSSFLFLGCSFSPRLFSFFLPSRKELFFRSHYYYHHHHHHLFVITEKTREKMVCVRGGLGKASVVCLFVCFCFCQNFCKDKLALSSRGFEG